MFRIFIFAAMLALHPVHVTLFSIEYSDEKDLFEGFLMVYFDDFLLDYEKLFTQNPEQEIIKGGDKARELLKGYLSERIWLYAGNRELKPDVSGFSLADNELKMSIVYNDRGRAKSYRIGSSILADIYSDQSNLLIFRIGSYEEGVKLTPEKREQVFIVKQAD